MNKLFFKIFIYFWLITIAVALSMVAASWYFSDDSESIYQNSWDLTRESIGIAAKAEFVAQHSSFEELNKWLSELDIRKEITFHLLQPNQSEEFITSKTDSFEGKDEFFERSRERSIYGSVIAKRGVPIAKLILINHRDTMTAGEFFKEFVWLRLVTAILVSGLICFIMAKAIIRPVVALRKATRQLAEGNLETRYSKETVSNEELYKLDSDVIGQLGDDFNYMAERLQQTIDEQKQLVRDISHELRSPLGRIQAALALAQRKADDETPELVRVEKECNRLNELIGQLLVVPNSDQSLSDVIDLVALVNDIAEDDELQVQQQNKRIEVKTSLDELLIQTSGNLLWHAVDNIVRNAIRHTPEGTTVTISITRDYLRDSVQITVADEGPGVPEESLEKIFHPFFRIESAREHGTGYGLGLSIASRAIIRHGGNISAHNLEQGLSVEILLPDQLISSDD